MLADPVIAELRADARRAVLELARVLARHADWRTMTSWRPRDRACAEIGSSRDPSRPLSISAYKRARQVLEERGFLGLVAQGWTPMLRAGALAEGGGTSAVFVLTIPLPRRSLSQLVNGPLTRIGDPVVTTPARARGQGGKTQLPERSHVAGRKTQVRGEVQTAAEVVIERARLLKCLSREHVASVIRPFVAAGWLPGDVLRAVDYSPDGRQHAYNHSVRHPAAWLRHRLAQWLTDAGPLPSPSQLRAADRDRVRAEQEAARAARREAAQQAALVDVAGRAGELRGIVAAVRRRQ